ncbi:hypothetical protein CYMTET_46421 [Cymbomonas tetramitiformis]|uniref:Uncharacterized protein n=1 Tax=Cymbomonas tetramitiformis TaxID=36881 RepID=A0AAE0BY45_9CHLO|nr:hypothetical protein CYMTET_46421 [Cymbomonas tetramitiformis]
MEPMDRMAHAMRAPPHARKPREASKPTKERVLREKITECADRLEQCWRGFKTRDSKHHSSAARALAALATACAAAPEVLRRNNSLRLEVQEVVWGDARLKTLLASSSEAAVSETVHSLMQQLSLLRPTARNARQIFPELLPLVVSKSASGSVGAVAALAAGVLQCCPQSSAVWTSFHVAHVLCDAFAQLLVMRCSASAPAEECRASGLLRLITALANSPFPQHLLPEAHDDHGCCIVQAWAHQFLLPSFASQALAAESLSCAAALLALRTETVTSGATRSRSADVAVRLRAALSSGPTSTPHGAARGEEGCLLLYMLEPWLSQPATKELGREDATFLPALKVPGFTTLISLPMDAPRCEALAQRSHRDGLSLASIAVLPHNEMGMGSSASQGRASPARSSSSR